MAVALKENRPVRGAEAIAERPDGTRVPFIPFPTPLHDSSGRLVGAVNMLVDITERKQAEARQKALLDEVNHRVKNTLATVQSLAAQTLRGNGVPADAFDAFDARLRALSKTHDELTDKQWGSADLASVIEEICAPYSGIDSRIHLAGAPVRLAPKAAVTLGMILHELATNAAKYGALSCEDGRVSVTWSLGAEGDGQLVIDWEESGGPEVLAPERSGFGSRLIERGTKQGLAGTARLDFDPAGLRCRIEVPSLSVLLG